MKKTKRNFSTLFVLLTVLFIGTTSFSTKDAELKEFKIMIESTDGGLKLTGLKGTAFTELSFSLAGNDQQGIDEFGMTVQDASTNSYDENLADFEFTIEKEKGGYVLVSKKGTAWTKLNFTFSQNNMVVINQYRVRVL